MVWVAEEGFGVPIQGNQHAQVNVRDDSDFKFELEFVDRRL